jgi:hypothetical protein
MSYQKQPLSGFKTPSSLKANSLLGNLIERTDWWKCALLSLLICIILLIISSSCNPAILAIDKFKNGITHEILKESAPEFSGIFEFILSKFFNSIFLSTSINATLFGLVLSFIFFITIPLFSSLFFALISHLVLIIGGAPGGWRMTFKSFSLHRILCDGATVLLLILVLILQSQIALAKFLLIVFLPMIRFGSLIFLWINLAKNHSLGAARIIFLGIPHIVLVSFFSIIVSELIAFWFCLYIIVGSLR